MPLVTSDEMLKKAQEKGYAIGAFNVENMEMVQAVIEAAEEMDAPVIVQTTLPAVDAGTELYFAMVAALAKQSKTPVVLHLDHGSCFELCVQALRAGYTSIMIDGSRLPLEENIALTRKVVEMCKPAGIPVEGEIGRVGNKEDGSASENAVYTIPAEAVRFEKETGVSSMAVGVGTAHGVYKAAPKLNTDLIRELKNTLTVPMVLHGASGLSDEMIKKCICCGICKVNFATELRIAYTKGVREILADQKNFDPKTYGRAGREQVKTKVKHYILTCGCAGATLPFEKQAAES